MQEGTHSFTYIDIGQPLGKVVVVKEEFVWWLASLARLDQEDGVDASVVFRIVCHLCEFSKDDLSGGRD
jgi:hypothetical protein